MAPRDGKIDPIQPGFIRNVIAGVRTVVSGVNPNNWFGPGQPMVPTAPEEVKGRAFDYQPGWNLHTRPRQDEAISFDQLRALADSYDLLRLVIETRKDQISKLDWTIQPRKRTGGVERPKADERVEEITRLLRRPDGINSWQNWLRMLMEDCFVLDAATIYPRFNRSGHLHVIEVIDGSTIRRVLDESGRTPMPPDPAYQQILKGMPAVNYTVDELLYCVRNPRPHKVYGFSPVEQIVMTVNIALRRQTAQLQYYSEGNIPEAIIGVPETWTPQQISEFQNYWDAMLEGNTAERRHAKFIPGGLTFQQTREPMLTDQFDEWLARVVCYAFSVPPLPFIQQQNRATAESAKEAALSEGLAPLMNWIKDIVDLLIERFWNEPDLEFCWGDHKEVDPASMASINSTYVRMGIKSIDEARAELGMDPLGMKHAIFTGNGAVMIEELANPKFRHALMGIQVGPDGNPIVQGQQPGMPGAEQGMLPGQPGMPGMPMGDNGLWMPDFRAALKPQWVPDFRQALTPEWLQGIREALLAGSASDISPDIRGALGLPPAAGNPAPAQGSMEVSGDIKPDIRGAMGMPSRTPDGMPDFNGILGGAGGSYTSDESMAAMNVRSADPTSKDDERRNVVLDLAGDEGGVDGDLSDNLDDPASKEVEKFDRPFVGSGSPKTFGALYKSDGRAGRDADGDGKTNEKGNGAAVAASVAGSLTAAGTGAVGYASQQQRRAKIKAFAEHRAKVAGRKVVYRGTDTPISNSAPGREIFGATYVASDKKTARIYGRHLNRFAVARDANVIDVADQRWSDATAANGEHRRVPEITGHDRGDAIETRNDAARGVEPGEAKAMRGMGVDGVRFNVHTDPTLLDSGRMGRTDAVAFTSPEKLSYLGTRDMKARTPDPAAAFGRFSRKLVLGAARVLKDDEPDGLTKFASFNELYKSDGRAGRDADGDGLVNERERPTPARLTPARPRSTNGLGEQPTPFLRAGGQVAGGAAVATAAAVVARSLSRSTNRAARVAGIASAGVSAMSGLAATALAGAATANDVMYQRRMEEVGQKYGFTPASRGERIVTEVQRARQSARGEAANYDRPIKGKPATEAGLPEYKAVQSFAKATQSAFPEDTQFRVNVRRMSFPEFDGDEEILSEQATVQTRFVKGGMTGEITRQFYRDKGGDLVAKHSSFVINGDGQGEGIGKRALKAQFDEYERMGVAKVKVHANIDVGGYAWARFGFVPTQSSWDALRTSMKTWVNSDRVLTDIFGNEYQPLNIPQRQRKALTKILDNPDPKGIWQIADARFRNRNLGKEILMERDWEGEIRLDDADAMARFNHYTGRSK